MLPRKPLKKWRHLPTPGVKKKFPYSYCRYTIRNLFSYQAKGYRLVTHFGKEPR